MKTEIHKLEEGFLDEIDEIEKQTFKDPWSKKSYGEEISNPIAVYRVITVENEVVAYGGFWQIFDEGHITNVAVKKEFRQKGLGTLLMNTLIEEAKKREICSMTLEVRLSNISAQRLYEKFGFGSAGVRPKYYADGEDAVIMWLEDISVVDRR